MVISSSLTPLAALLVPHRPCSGPLWFYRVGKRPPVKADLAIYSLIVGMSGQWVNVATMLNNKLDFYCCDNSVSFCKSSHIYSNRTHNNLHTVHLQHIKTVLRATHTHIGSHVVTWSHLPSGVLALLRCWESPGLVPCRRLYHVSQVKVPGSPTHYGR